MTIINWISERADKIINIILKPLLSLPSILQLIAIVTIFYLAVVGLIRVASRALKLVITIACVFLVLLIVWLLFF